MVPFMRVLIVSALFVACVFGQSNKQPKPVFEVAADSAVGISKSPPVVESDGSASSQAAHNDTKSFLVDDSDDSDDSAESGNFNPHSGKTSGYTILVKGTGKATEIADLAKIEMTTSFQGPDSREFRAWTGNMSREVLSRVIEDNPDAISKNNVTITSLAVYPKVTYLGNGSSEIETYVFEYSFSIAVGQVTPGKISSLIASAKTWGGSNITLDSVEFKLSYDLSEKVAATARKFAARDAWLTAQQYAEGFGVKLVQLQSIQVEDQIWGSGSKVERQYGSGNYQSTAAVNIAGSADISPTIIGSQTLNARVGAVYSFEGGGIDIHRD